MGAVFPRDTETTWIGNQFMKTTLRNFLEKTRAPASTSGGPGIRGCYKIKGMLRSEQRVQTGDDAGWAEIGETGIPCRSLLVMKVTGVYDCMPGDHTGDRLM